MLLVRRSRAWFRTRFWDSLGPGLITGAADDDPSGIATYSIAGAQLGPQLLWTALLTWPLMAAVQMMCARVGMVTGRGLTASLTSKFPRRAVLGAITALLIANTINVAADLSGMSDAAEMVTGLSSHLWVFVFALVISWATIRFRYYQIAATLKWLCLTLFAYVAVGFMVKANWSSVLHATFIPSMPRSKQSWQTLVAILGTTISPYLFFWQATQEVEEEKASGRNTLGQRKGATAEEIRTRKYDVGIGTFFSNLVMYFIILTTAFTLNQAGVVNVTTSRQVSEALQPLAGRMASLLYTMGIVGVGLLAIPTLTGSAAYAFADALGWRKGLDKQLRQARSFYMMILLSTGLAVVLDFADVNPITALYWTAIVNGVLAPFLLVSILLVACDKSLMGTQTSSLLGRIAVTIITLLMFVAAIAMFVM